MTVHFIGAGPGAADLLTVRAVRLLASSPVCVYAGTYLDVEVLSHCPPDATLIDSAGLSLDEITAHLVAAHAADQDVARLCSGDPSLYSALAEQARRVERRITGTEAGDVLTGRVGCHQVRGDLVQRESRRVDQRGVRRTVRQHLGVQVGAGVHADRRRGEQPHRPYGQQVGGSRTRPDEVHGHRSTPALPLTHSCDHSRTRCSVCVSGRKSASACWVMRSVPCRSRGLRSTGPRTGPASSRGSHPAAPASPPRSGPAHHRIRARPRAGPARSPR